MGEVARYDDGSASPEPQSVANMREQERSGREWTEMVELMGEGMSLYEGGSNRCSAVEVGAGGSCGDGAGFGLLPAAERDTANDHVS